jgi:hypothetical protein
MSVLSTLALLVTAAARPKPKRVAQLADEIIRLNLELGEREAQIAKIAEDRDMWRERAVIAPPMNGRNALAYAQQNAGLAQQNSLLAQQQYAGSGTWQNAQVYGQGMMLGAQALDPELWCNCVPSRSQVWAANEPEA